MMSNFMRVLFTVFLVMDPIGMIPVFLSHTEEFDNTTRKGIINKAVLIAGIVLFVFILTGKLLLKFFGIMPGSFYISGGILFFVIAFGMIYSQPKLTRTIHPKKSGTAEGEDSEDRTGISIAIFPLAIPLIAGPGMLTVIVMFVSGGESWLGSVALLFPAIVINLLAVHFTLRCSVLVLKFLGSMGISIIEKIMGLILAGFSIQLVYDGLTALSVIKL